MSASVRCITRQDVAALLPPRRKDSQKGDNGRALLCVGSERYTGAALLSAAAALRAGCGLLEVAVPRAVKPAFAALPEACCTPVGSGGAWSRAALVEAAALLPSKQSIGIGCGMDALESDALLLAALQSKKPLAIDADGLNYLSAHKDLYPQLHDAVVLTPHPGEMARLSGEPIERILADPAAAAQQFANAHRCIVLLKGAESYIASETRILRNATGNPGLAKGGSGDVLTGLIVGLMAQGCAPFDAACIGAYLLGSSADTALSLLGNRMLMAGDVVSAVEQTLWALPVDAGHSVGDR